MILSWGEGEALSTKSEILKGEEGEVKEVE
jgi:hypothetical protein